MFGIENLKKVFVILIDAGNVAGELLAMPDKKWYEKLGPVAKVLEESVGLLSVDWKTFPKELADLDATEREELLVFFKEKFDIPEEEAEAFVEKAFTVLLSVIECTLKVIELTKSFKKS